MVKRISDGVHFICSFSVFRYHVLLFVVCSCYLFMLFVLCFCVRFVSSQIEKAIYVAAYSV